MNLYGLDLSMYDYGLADPAIVESLSRNSRMMMSSSSSLFATVDYDDDDEKFYSRPHRTISSSSNSNPPNHRHDGTSPLPLGMDWSPPPPRLLDGRDSVWPHDPPTGWSYCVKVPSWTIQSYARGSDSVVFYKVQVGVQSPEGITTTCEVLRRFNDFLALFAELRKAFPIKNLPPVPSKRLLKMRSKTLLEERRCALEDWMWKLLSDIDVSRTAPVAIFLELEVAARSSFYNSNQGDSEVNSVNSIASSDQYPTNLGSSFLRNGSSVISDYGKDSDYETSELGTPRGEPDNSARGDMENAPDRDIAAPTEETLGDGLSGNTTLIEGKQARFSPRRIQHEGENSSMHTHHEDKLDFSSSLEDSKLSKHLRGLSNQSIESGASSSGASESSTLDAKNSHGDAEASSTTNILLGSGLLCQSDFVVALPSDKQHNVRGVLSSTQQRLGTSKTDMEELIARLNQETAVRQYLTMKVKDLEVELETTRQSSKENLQEANLIERERWTQMQWDMEELRRKYLEVELKLKSEEEARHHLESTQVSNFQKNEMLVQELDHAKEQVDNLKKRSEELDSKSKSEVKLLVKEVKSLRISQLELKEELGRCLKEVLDLENDVQKDKERKELAFAAKEKLLHECEILRNRLQECSVGFLIEEENRLILDSSSPSDAIDLLAISDNRICLLLAEAQLLSQDVESAIAAASEKTEDIASKTENKLRMMLTDIFIDNARLRKQINSVLRCALNMSDKTEKAIVDEDVPPRETVLGKFL